jgi:hypothetical protein
LIDCEVELCSKVFGAVAYRHAWFLHEDILIRLTDRLLSTIWNIRPRLLDLIPASVNGVYIVKYESNGVILTRGINSKIKVYKPNGQFLVLASKGIERGIDYDAVA